MAFDNPLTDLVSDEHHPLARHVALWSDASPRFRTFVETYRDKIRKKVRTTSEVDALADIEAELAIAALLLRDRRLTIEYEKLGVGNARAPDLTVTFKTHTLCHVEVTRLRSVQPAANDVAEAQIQKLASTLCDKLGQLPPSAANLMAVAAEPGQCSVEMFTAAMQRLRQQAERKNNEFFRQCGLQDVRHFHRQQPRLSGILLCWLQPPACQAAGLWLNPQTKHPLPAALQTLLRGLV
ncbi:MAG TPA: hypothetical protein PKE45_17065 [Caldilineaceae bacterium]|nr:hypothetical protein [Caldilineaceae bacterium]